MTNLPCIARKHLNSKPFTSSLCAAVLLVAGLAALPSAPAQVAAVRLADRITSAIDNTSRAALTGSMPARARHSTDLGSIAPDTKLQGITLAFSRTAAQQADLSALILAQQTPGSPQFHQWLTPAQFGARFGVSDNDLAATESWLQSQGFTIDSVSPSRESITFSGSARSVESAFGSPLHYFRSNSDTVTHFAPAGDLTVPAALSSVVLAVANLSSYRPRSHAIMKPAFTSSQTGSNFMTPKDVATIYDINTAYNSGYTGLGQTIAVVGESLVLTSDITNFQTSAGVPANLPNMFPVPNSGTYGYNINQSGDEAESDLDLEYSSAIAYKATIDFVYTGNAPNQGVFQSVIYAIQQDLAPIITISYGECEADLGQYYFNYFEGYFQQAAAQGQTVINSSGDSGSTACYGDGNTTAYQEQLAVNYPASSQYVTGLGGTEFPVSDITYAKSSGVEVVGSNSATYWSKASGTDVIGSALSYIPEQAWNDDSSSGGLSSGGGGVSIYSTRPSWQTGVTGITAGNYRLVPDVSLDASPNDAGYLFCSSDTGTVGFSGSCTNGFRVSSAYTDSGGLTIIGGTSVAAPLFAGMLAIINQAKGYTTGQGLINPTLYTLASNSTTYASAFHDIYVAGQGNNCTAGSTYCSGTAVTSYLTTTGYDEATGLGSVDLTKLISVWPANTSGSASLLKSSISTTVNNLAPAVSSTDAITLQVACASGSLCTGTTVAGTVTVTDTVNGVTTTPAGSPINLTNGAAIYTYTTPSTGGVHQLVFSYGGNGTYAASKATVFLDVASANFSVAGSATTVASSGGNSTVTVTVTPTNGYTGTVQLNLAASSSLTNTCYSGPYSVSISGTSATTATYTLYTGVTSCPTGAYPLVKTATGGLPALRVSKAEAPAVPHSPWHSAPLPAALAGLLVLGCWKRRSRLLRAGIALGIVLIFGLSGVGLSGCSSGASGNTSTTGSTAGSTYTLAIYANDSADPAISNNATFTLTIN
jgi:hypothetical protein